MVKRTLARPVVYNAQEMEKAVISAVEHGFDSAIHAARASESQNMGFADFYRRLRRFRQEYDPAPYVKMITHKDAHGR